MALFGPNPNQVVFQQLAAHFGQTISDKANQFEIQREKRTYRVHFHQHKSTIRLTITGEAGRLPPATLRKESRTDSFGKRIGLNYEFQSGDTLFDSKVFIVCDRDSEPVERLLEPDGVRKGALFLLLAGFDDVSFGRDGYWTERSYTRTFSLSVQEFEEALTALDLIGDAVPAFAADSLRYPRLTPMSVVAGIQGTLMFLGILSFPIGLALYRTLDRSLFLYAVGIALALWFFSLFASARFLRGKADAFRAWLLMVILGLFSLPLVMIGGMLIANGLLDTSASIPHSTKVLGKRTSRSKNSTSYHLRVRSWRKSETSLEIRVSRYFYDSHAVGGSATVSTRSGFLGFEWVSSP